MKTCLTRRQFILICLILSYPLLANPLKKEPPILDDSSEHFHHYLNIWPKQPRSAKHAAYFFTKLSYSPHEIFKEDGQVWVNFDQGDQQLELPLDDDYPIFVDHLGQIYDKEGYHIPNNRLFDEAGYFRGYDLLKPDKTRAFGRAPNGQWLYKFCRRGHAWCRKLPR